jgi:predicted ATP-grasp superfamily ATP-dependent carboligase
MPETINPVILLDGNQRSSLAVVRSLGGKGISVYVGAETEPSLAARSRYCKAAFPYPSPASDPGAFLSRILQITRQNPEALLLPMTDVTMGEILGNADRFPESIRIPFGGYRQYSALSDKAHLFRQARALGVATPVTVFSTDLDSCATRTGTDPLADRELSYPVVVKPAASRIRTAGGWISTTVGYARSPGQLQAMLSGGSTPGAAFLIQEKIRGPGIGIFLLLAEGKVLARFAHQRVREKPPSGGVSVVCRSIEPPADALRAAESLMGSSGWSGVAMVEFKHDLRDGQCKLMEVNARFWGSLQLAVSSGVDFPHLLYNAVTGNKPEKAVSYRKGLYSRWELGDLDHLLIRMKGSRRGLNLPPGAPSKRETLSRFLKDFFQPEIRSEVFRGDDPGPFFFELNRYVKDILRRN